MDERELRHWIERVKAGAIGRRQFTRAMLGLGVTGPLCARMLAAAGAARAEPRPPAFTPTRRGGGGELKVLWWQAATILNPHLAVGVKDNDGSRVFYEPLAGFDGDGHLVPALAAEIPSLQNGGVAKDGLSVTWRLRKDVQWHDGKPFTADDVVFTWEYAADPATTATTAGQYKLVARVDKIDSHTVKVVFAVPEAFWPIVFCGSTGQIIPRHVFEPFRGAKSREAPANLKPVGTGPYRCIDFKPGDTIRAEINATYHRANWPFFDRFQMKGGGDAVSAARAVLQTGEYDFAWNMQVEDDILRRLEQGGKGRVDFADSGNIEHIACNFSDPWREVDGERASAKTAHPLLGDAAVRAALNVLVDRGSIQEQIYGRLGQATANYLNAPSPFRSPTTRWEWSVDKANQLLESAGWKRGPDGVRVKDGKRLKLLFQTSINTARQKTQAIVKQAAVKAGIEMELKSVVPSVYFSGDPGNADTLAQFAADIQMYSWQFGVDPQRSLEVFTSWEVAQKANKWAGRNTSRWRNEDYDRLWKASATELDPVKRAAIFIRMNDLVIQNVVVIPVLWRKWVSAVAHSLKSTDMSGWDSSFWNLAHWYRSA